jgi:hypothetical protein
MKSNCILYFSQEQDQKQATEKTKKKIRDSASR